MSNLAPNKMNRTRWFVAFINLFMGYFVLREFGGSVDSFITWPYQVIYRLKPENLKGEVSTTRSYNFTVNFICNIRLRNFHSVWYENYPKNMSNLLNHKLGKMLIFNQNILEGPIVTWKVIASDLSAFIKS